MKPSWRNGASMKILLIGSKGQLGQDMLASLPSGFTMVGMDYPQIDITKKEETIRIIREVAPEVIVNCAAFTAMDLCEQEKGKAFSVNADGIKNIALGAKEIQAIIIHYSTDYVFDGSKKAPYLETDEAHPLSVYGQSKLQGEIELTNTWEKHYILRLAWLYGTKGNNFVRTMVNIGKRKENTGKFIKVVNDQWGTPTCTLDVCEQTFTILSQGAPYGLYHCTSEGGCTWYEFALYILASYNITSQILACTSEEYPRPAKRPLYAVLENERLKKLGLHQMIDWKESFQRFMKKKVF